MVYLIDQGYTHIFKENLIYDDVAFLGRLRFDRAVIVTNQSGINRGYYSEEQFHLFMSEMIEYLRETFELNIDKYYFCPHDPTKEVCRCRKPLPGMLLTAVADYNLSLDDCVLVGDKTSDIEAGKLAGAT